ncbi:DUF6576 domain-containing protein [Polluticaenibacter yanchengensis]|uniref:DUF6576 domain-containing protein n=1 Tax=Polluticaenibacter yanchengensis TaxID=3014562 RepID=A0ABT4UL71_9BACT|nr:hypothetical protein [Chitinophagaceae bacterium LY-5]
MDFLVYIVAIAAIIGVIIYKRKNRIGTPTTKPDVKEGGDITIDDRFNISKKSEEEQLNALLDKIAKRGINSLSKLEKERLDYLSKKLN